jgi:hypothetical protein
MLPRNPKCFATSLSLLPIRLLNGWMILLLAALGWSPVSSTGAEDKNEIRTWTSYEGTVLTASFVSSDGTDVTLDRRNGSDPVTIPIERFTFEDQVFVAGMEALQRGASPAVAWPDKVAIPAIQVVKKHARDFVTENFSFLCELDTGEEFVQEAATYFEGTLAAIRALPFDLRAEPPAGWQQFVVTFGQRTSIEDLIAAGPRPHPAQPLLAGYIGEHRQIVVPYDSIEGRTREGLPGLKLREDFGLLIHEITHQVIDNTLTILPYWISDGLAEYMSVVPMKDGAFHFSRTEVEARLKKVLKDRYSQSSLEIMHPRDLMHPLSGKVWTNDVDGQIAALLTVYYLIHLQNPDSPGESITTAVHILRTIDDRAWDLIEEYNTALEDATPAIEKYRGDLERYQKKVLAYNKRVNAVRQGKPVLVEGSGAEGGRVVVGGGLTAPPVAPTLPKLPDILEHRRAKALEVGDFSLPLTVRALLKGRSYEQFADDMKAAYAEIGLTVAIRPAEAKRGAAP